MFVRWHSFAAFKAATSVRLQWYYTPPDSSGNVEFIQALDRDGVTHAYFNNTAETVHPDDLTPDAIQVDELGV